MLGIALSQTLLSLARTDSKQKGTGFSFFILVRGPLFNGSLAQDLHHCAPPTPAHTQATTHPTSARSVHGSPIMMVPGPRTTTLTHTHGRMTGHGRPMPPDLGVPELGRTINVLGATGQARIIGRTASGKVLGVANGRLGQIGLNARRRRTVGRGVPRRLGL